MTGRPVRGSLQRVLRLQQAPAAQLDSPNATRPPVFPVSLIRAGVMMGVVGTVIALALFFVDRLGYTCRYLQLDRYRVRQTCVVP